MNNIVIFGKAHSGKSTLLGYLVSQGWNLNKTEKKIKRELNDIGVTYDDTDFYRYIVDDTKEERLKRKNEPGSTLVPHFRKINLPDLGDITIIDTPGMEHKKNSRQKGMFYADIGIFCIEMTNVINDSFYKKGESDSIYSSILSTLMLWTSLRRKRIIVALTKVDLCHYSEKDFIDAKRRIQKICNEVSVDVKIVPVSVDVRGRQGNNIIDISHYLDWYRGKPLIKYISANVLQIEKNIKEENRLLFCVDREYNSPSSYVGKVWRIKIISGKLNVGDIITLSPVINNYRNFVAITAQIKTIRFDNHRDEDVMELESANSGSIVGIDLKHLRCGGRRISKSDFNTIYTSCGFHATNNSKIAKTFIFRIDQKYENIFTVNRHLNLLWFGRTVSFKILDATAKDDMLFVKAEILTRRLSLPINDENQYFFTSLIITGDNAVQSEYYKATLIELLDIDGEGE